MPACLMVAGIFCGNGARGDWFVMMDKDHDSGYRWASEECASEEDVRFLRDQINEFNFTATDIYDGRGLSIFVRDEQDQILAGIDGWTWGQCLYIQYLWVREDLRGKGFGKKLLLAAEKEATARGCSQSILDSHSFQAPGFYQKFGYEVIGAVNDYPVGHSSIYFRKSLS